MYTPTLFYHGCMTGKIARICGRFESLLLEGRMVNQAMDEDTIYWLLRHNA